VDLNIGPSYADPSFNLGEFGVAPDADNTFVFELSDLDGTPRCIRQGKLLYPNELKRFKLSGEVRLVVLIRKDGTVKVLEVQKSTHPAFERAAIQAAETSLYESPRRNGEAVAVRFFLPVKFEFQ
jgi:TonB family protein